MVCKRDSGDKLMMALVAKGINLILPPRDHVEPGDLIVAEKDNSIRTASWEDVLGVNVKAEVQADEGFRALSFESNSVLEVGAAAAVLGTVLQLFGLESAAFSTAFSSANAKTISLKLVAPASRSLANVDGILRKLNQDKAEPVAGYADRRFLVVMKVWRARGLRISVADNSGANAKLTAEAEKELSASATVELKKEDDGSYVFASSKPMIFGLTFREIVYKDGAIIDVVVDHHMKFRAAKPEDPGMVFIGEDAFVQFPSDA